MLPCSSTMNSCGSRWIVWRSGGSETERARSTACRTSSRLISRGREASVMPPAVEPADVWPADADRCSFDRHLRGRFGLFDGALNRSRRLVQLDNYPFARAARVGNAVSAIAQAGIGDLSYHDASLGAAYVENADRVFVYLTHLLKTIFTTEPRRTRRKNNCISQCPPCLRGEIALA